MEFDQSQLFQKIYSQEFGTPGGIPFSILIGDYYLTHRPSADHPTDDGEALQAIASVAAASFAPFITGVAPAMFGLDSFTELEHPLNISRIFAQTEYQRWRSMRANLDTRFAALILPRILMRPLYADDGSMDHGFRFEEDGGRVGADNYLWGNAAFAMGAVAIRAFVETGWLADIRGVVTDTDSGGLVSGLTVPDLPTDAIGLVPNLTTEVQIPDSLDASLGDQGFIPLIHCKGTRFAAFYGSQTVHQPKSYDTMIATLNARLSAALQHVLCTSRFAHYLKVMGRDKTGSLITANAVEQYLNTWLLDYCSASDDSSEFLKAKYPLREGNVAVREVPGKPGEYACTIHLRPHFQFDHVVSSVRLMTSINAPQAAG
jgi:type VI secretion system protein ImpD